MCTCTYVGFMMLQNPMAMEKTLDLQNVLYQLNTYLNYNVNLNLKMREKKMLKEMEIY